MTRTKLSVGDILKAARKKKALSLSQVADAAGIPKSVLGDWELDQIASPDLNRLTRLAHVLDVEPTRLHRAAGYDIDAALPGIQPYLRSKYKHLPPAARSEIKSAFERISAKYGGGPEATGPHPGQDE